MVVQVEDQLNHLETRQDPAETPGLFSPGNHSRVASGTLMSLSHTHTHTHTHRYSMCSSLSAVLAVGCGLQMDSPVTMIWDLSEDDAYRWASH